MIQFKENAWTDGWKDGRTDGRADRPYFIGPFQLPLGVKKVEKLVTNLHDKTEHIYLKNLKQVLIHG